LLKWYTPGKTCEQINAIVRGLLSHNTGPVLLTRIDAETADAIRVDIGAGDYDREARLMSWRAAPVGEFTVTVVSAGTTDWPVAAEARAVASAVGMNTRLIHDVGVARLDRICR
jgi:NCAIR mutase (PurE)-related protein